MKIFINGNSLKAFTSGTPQRGLIFALCQLRKKDTFYIYYSCDSEAIQISSYWTAIESLENVRLVPTQLSQKVINLKKLIGLNKYQNIPDDFDFYFSPGMPEYFNAKCQPSISTVADLSSINSPETSSLKWHGNRIFHNTLNWCIKSNTLIGAISDFTKHELIEKFPNHQKQFFTLHNGIENFWFDDKYETNELTQKYKQVDYWVWWGFGSNRKNLARLLKAYLEIKEKDNSIPKLLLIGQLADDQKHLLDNISSCYSIEIIPFQAKYILKELVRNSKGLLFPSLYEGFGLPIIETYSQGCPVLYSNCTSMPEVASVYGIPVNPLDIESIKSGLIKLNAMKITKENEIILKSYAKVFNYCYAAKKLSSIIDKIV